MGRATAGLGQEGQDPTMMSVGTPGSMAAYHSHSRDHGHTGGASLGPPGPLTCGAGAAARRSGRRPAMESWLAREQGKGLVSPAEPEPGAGAGAGAGTGAGAGPGPWLPHGDSPPLPLQLPRHTPGPPTCAPWPLLCPPPPSATPQAPTPRPCPCPTSPISWSGLAALPPPGTPAPGPTLGGGRLPHRPFPGEST